MIKNYLKIAWRNLANNKTLSFINIGGLATGMAVALLIGLWIWDELSFNNYHKNSARIAQVLQHQHFNGEIHSDKAVPLPLATALRSTYGNDFKYIVLSSWTNPHTLSFKEKNLSALGNFMEPDAAHLLTLKMLKGSAAGLQDPFSILLSEPISKAIFGDADPIGQILKLDTTLVKVTGIYEKLPYNSQFSNVFFIAPWALYSSSDEIKSARDDWNNNSFQLFVQVSDSRKVPEISSKIKDIKRSKLGDEAANLKPEIFLHPMNRWHLYPEFKNGANTSGQIQYLWMFGIIGVFVLLLACINFMNLSTARSERRAKEIGIRKAIGSMRGQLIRQFLSESLFVAFVAFAFSLILVQLILPLFNEITDKKITVSWDNILFWLLGIGFSLITGLIAGSYPALYLSSFKPVKVLKGTFRAGRFATLPRKVLVVLQFSVTIILIISTIVVFRQIQFAKNRDIGYDGNQLIVIRPYSTEFHDHFSAMHNDLLQTGLIKEMAESGSSITRGSRTNGGFKWKGKDPNMADEFTTVGVSTEYGNAIDWKIIDGRDFSKNFPADSSALILNEAAVKYMGLKNPIGEIITWDKEYRVVGVIKNILMESPYEPVKQAIYYITPEAGYLNIKIRANANINQALKKIETICKKYSPTTPFEYKFADEEFAKKFADTERIGKLASGFTILAILISCLGLFGMASFMASQRIKEIGMRKILGASVFNIWQLLSKEFVLLILISLFIATPAAYYFMHNWIQNYEYRAGISWWIFVAAGFGALLITLITVSFQAIKAALANPVKSLGTE